MLSSVKINMAEDVESEFMCAIFKAWHKKQSKNDDLQEIKQLRVNKTSTEAG